MARQETKRRSSNSNRSRAGSRNGRSASQKPEKYRFAQNVGGDETVAEREYRAYALPDREDTAADPDVLLDVPVVKVDSIHLELDDLEAHVALKALIFDLVKLNVGIDVELGKLRLDIKGVEAQALVKVRLDHVAAIVDRVLTTVDRNPELLENLGEAVEEIGKGAGHLVGEGGEAVEDVGEGAGQAVEQVGEGAGQGIGDIGEGAGQAVGEIGEGAGQGLGEAGQGAGQAVGDIGEGAGQAVGNLDQTVEGLGQTAGQAGQGVGQAVGGLGEGVGEAGQGVGQAVGGVGQAAGELGQAAGGLAGGGGGQAGAEGGEGGLPGASAGDAAKLAAKTVAKELAAAASQEAKDLSLAATRKAKEAGERRRQRKADDLNATAAALRTAQELGIDLEEVEGTGQDGRITVGDVRKANGS